MSETESPQREKAVPRMLQEVATQAERLAKLGEELESRLSNGLRPETSNPTIAVEEKSEAPDACYYEQQLSGIYRQLTTLERRLDSILGRLEV